jgi:hypothetical protein
MKQPQCEMRGCASVIVENSALNTTTRMRLVNVFYESGQSDMKLEQRD